MSNLPPVNHLSPHFTEAEFASPDGAPTPAQYEGNLTHLAWTLEKIRAHFGVPVHVDSGYRSPAHNKAVGGVPDSQHLTGHAADIVVAGFSPHTVGEFAATLPEVGGVGIYPTEGFTHVDTRPRSGGPVARWVG